MTDNFTLKKITIKEVCGAQSKPEKEKDLMRVFGSVHDTKVVTTTYGDSTGLKGQFRAINLETGEVFNSGICFLPDIITDVVAGQLMANDEINSLAFGYDIGIKPDDPKGKPTAIGYTYTAKALIQPDKDSDPLSIMQGSLPDLPVMIEGKKK